MPATPERAQLVVRVTPDAKRTEFAGWTADEKGRPVTADQAPPVDGKANTELIRFLNKSLGCSKGARTLLRDDTSRQKCIEGPRSALDRLPEK